MHYHFLQLCSGKNRQGSTSVTSFQNCDVPNVATKIIYLAVLHPVLNIFSVSCTPKAQQGKPFPDYLINGLLIWKQRKPQKPKQFIINITSIRVSTETSLANKHSLDLDPGDHCHGRVDDEQEPEGCTIYKQVCSSYFPNT